MFDIIQKGSNHYVHCQRNSGLGRDRIQGGLTISYNYKKSILLIAHIRNLQHYYSNKSNSKKMRFVPLKILTCIPSPNNAA